MGWGFRALFAPFAVKNRIAHPERKRATSAHRLRKEIRGYIVNIGPPMPRGRARPPYGLANPIGLNAHHARRRAHRWELFEIVPDNRPGLARTFFSVRP